MPAACAASVIRLASLPAIATLKLGEKSPSRIAAALVCRYGLSSGLL